jgi:hypothetical protein
MSKKPKYQISAEAAQDQLDILIEYYDMDFEVENDSDDVQKAAAAAVEKLKRYIRLGRVEITDTDGLTVIQHLKYSKGDTKSIPYRVCDGRAKMAMSKAGEKDYSGKIFQLMGSLANVPASSLEKLTAVDSNVVECLGAVFLTA